MKALKIVAVIILLLIAIPLITALFVKSNYSVEVETMIKKPRSEVFEYVKLLKNQDNFSTWAKIDPGMEKNFSGTDGKAGFISAWKSDHPDVGSGEQEIIKIIEPEQVDFKLRFFEPFPGEADAYLKLEEATESETLIKWGFRSGMSYPMNLMLLLYDMEEMIGTDLMTGLQNLKEILEGMEAEESISVEERE